MADKRGDGQARSDLCQQCMDRIATGLIDRLCHLSCWAGCGSAVDFAPPDAAACLSAAPQRRGSQRLRRRDKAPERVTVRVVPRDQRRRLRDISAEIRPHLARLVARFI